MFNRWSQFLCWTCVALWSGIFVTGLWPFNFYPRNRTRWIQAGNGLHFDAYSQTYSTVLWTLNESSGTEDLSFTIELWLRVGETRHTKTSTIFSVHGASDDHDLSIVQSGPDLVVRGYFRDRNSGRQFRQLWLHDAGRSSQPIFMTITSSQKGTILYWDANPQQPERYASLFPERYLGRLLLGDAPGGNDPWTGDILGLAVYGRALPADEIAQHYRDWLQHKPHLQQGARALYTFDERAGELVHNRSGSAPNLIIPARFKPLHPTVLALPRPFRLHRIDTVVNVLGFIPLGFFLCAYLGDAKHHSARNAFAQTIILGAVTSLGIELLQVFLPTRDSSLLDVVNNVVGTTVGAFLQIRVHDWWRETIWWLIPGARPSRFED
jgi:VanZ family protein